MTYVAVALRCSSTMFHVAEIDRRSVLMLRRGQRRRYGISCGGWAAEVGASILLDLFITEKQRGIDLWI